MAKLTDTVVITTGVSSGIGEATIKRSAEEGAKVVPAGRNDKKLQRVAEHLNEGNYFIMPANVMYRDDVGALVESTIAKFGKTDIFVNCAGTNLPSKITDYKVDDWDKMVDTNIKGLLYGLNAVLSHFEEQSSGHIVNMAFISGFEVNKTGVLYSATKSAALCIVKALEKEFARTGTKSTSILPGMVDTSMTEGYDFGDREKLDPENIVGVVIYAVTQPAHVNANEVVVRPVQI